MWWRLNRLSRDSGLIHPPLLPDNDAKMNVCKKKTVIAAVL
jgi:hypothetical protein